MRLHPLDQPVFFCEYFLLMATIFKVLGEALKDKLGEKLDLTGGTMTGHLSVSTPTASNQVATSGQVTDLESAFGNYGDFVESNADVTVSIFDTFSNIQGITNQANGAIAVSSDGGNIYYWDGASWVQSSISSIKADSLAASG